MTPQVVQDILQDFANRAARIGAVRRDGSELWRFSVDAHVYDLHYFPDDDTLIRRKLGGADAARMFAQLQALQKLGVPATRVIANLKGLRIGERKGDACIVVHDASVRPLTDVAREVAGRSRTDRLRLIASLVQRLEVLHRHKLCPQPLTIDRFGVRSDGSVVITDASGVLGGIVDEARLHELDASTRSLTSSADRLRLWRHFTNAVVPRRDRALARIARSVARDADKGIGRFGSIEWEGWHGVYAHQVPLALPWSRVTDLTVDAATWCALLPRVFESAGWSALKQDAASHVRASSLAFVDDATGERRSIEVVVKRPSTRAGVRGLFRRVRRSRARRAWLKTWRLLAAGFPCEVPLLLLERRRGPFLVDQLVIFERVPGPTMADVDLDALPQQERERLLSRCGRLLRLLERDGFTHQDAKNTNWIAWRDASGTPQPVLIDLDGVRPYGPKGRGFARLARAMRTHRQFIERDHAALEAGYRG